MTQTISVTTCDRCGKKIDKQPKHQYKLYRVEYRDVPENLKNIPTIIYFDKYEKRYFPDLCEDCSRELDNFLDKWVKEAKRVEEDNNDTRRKRKGLLRRKSKT